MDFIHEELRKEKLKLFSFFRKMLTWTERIYRDFKRNPLSCNKCGTSMELMYLYHYKYGFFLPKIKIYISPP